ncbi:Cystathionine beta-lyase [Monocercomonoides exilis]|uniref:Cystathionine beta-lyase n=1 Tax=Monocercomonoides exilis TaxID=2049356 RepID=UPI00355A112B|nr:Cystathionine beta-lyase [Monocercomonoides exilis]|eukprot:MONOS_1054.1-p1 / transcript=MONOS_1054.1 / gene=MONOS_1054 / organism=Monocercomonoides_exilis_PA203 / gene_product=Cystathionine beta-lyase / transcript_product=Cystathionine beta-lyase / location=Mono_scaffold00018:7455-9417(+) / protein_length=456 / sequence_SO=supercontig / SO=protein_coding / is_pseudo=false
MSQEIPLEFVDRSGTDCVKWDIPHSHPSPMMMWVADMEIASPKPVVDAITKRAAHHAYGYPVAPKEVNECIRQWAAKCFNWDISTEWISHSPGVCGSVAASIQAFTQPGDRIVVLSPIYFPLTNLPEDNGREAVRSSLIFDDKTRKWNINWDDFERKISLPRVKMFILCNPHNPTGRMWTREELTRLGELCLKHEVLIVSDEIHWDFALPREGSTPMHVPIASISPELSRNTLTFSAPSKTFNIPSFQFSFCIASNPRLREGFNVFLSRNAAFAENVFAFPAAIAAYTHCYQWVRDCDALFRKHCTMVYEMFSKDKFKGLVDVVDQEATFLLFINMNKAINYFHEKAMAKAGGATDELRLSNDKALFPLPRNTHPVTGAVLVDPAAPAAEFNRRTAGALKDFIFQKTGVLFNEGSQFGIDGDGWVRMNVGTKTENVEETLKRLESLFDTLFAAYP